MPVCLSKALRWLSNNDISAASTDNAVITHQSTKKDVFHVFFLGVQQRGVAMLGRKRTDTVREGRDDAWPWDAMSIRDPQAPWATLGKSQPQEMSALCQHFIARQRAVVAELHAA